jgi:hypothetical protein
MWKGKGAPATAAILGVGLLLAGCGGGGGDSKPQSSIPKARTAAPQSQYRKPGHHRAHSTRRRVVPHRPATSLQQALESVPAAKRLRLASSTAEIVLRVFGFRSPTVSVGPNGSAIHAIVAADQACSNDAQVETRIVSRLRQTLAFVDTVSITVAGSGRSLAEYVRRSCAGAGLNAGPGRVVLTQKGASFATTRSFTVHSPRWTIDYINNGAFLQVLPMKGRLPTAGAFTTVSRGRGRHVIRGAGTFTLRIGGESTWTVRVRDAA